MRRTLIGSILVVVACVGLTGAGDDENGARLTRLIDRIAVMFPAGGITGSPEALADQLVAADARVDLFRLEGLIRLYRHKFSDLEKHLDPVKEVEDGLGAYEFARDALKFAEDKNKKQAEPEGVLDALRKKRDSARTVIAKLLATATLGSDLPKLRALVTAKFGGWDPSKDLSYVKDELIKMLLKVKDGRLNLNQLEDGIHEFRRQLRWFPVTIDALDGFVQVRDDPQGACPVRSLESMAGSPVAKNKYANPGNHFPAAHGCAVSRCLLWGVVRSVRDLGRLKDEAQGNLAVGSAMEDIDIASSNKASPAEIANAKAIRNELFSSKALDGLIKQIASCKG